jgi:thioredoxin reductase (NADPH)
VCVCVCVFSLATLFGLVRVGVCVCVCVCVCVMDCVCMAGVAFVCICCLPLLRVPYTRTHSLSLSQHTFSHTTHITSESATSTSTSTSSSTPSHPFWARTEDNRVIRARAVIVATGATAHRLGVPGEAHLWNKGVSACAVCDGALPMFRARPVAVVGGGDSACEEALFLSRYASQVYLLVRRDSLRASRIMQQRLFQQNRVQVLWRHEVEQVLGDELVRQIVVRDRSHAAVGEPSEATPPTDTRPTGELRTLDVAGLFYAVGHRPNTAFLAGQVRLDTEGFLHTPPGRTDTSVRGVFGAGDVLADQKPWRQAITAAGSGCMAALQSIEYLDQSM